MKNRFWKNATIITAIALLVICTGYLRMRSSLLAMDIGEMNKSQFWKASSLVLLDGQERSALSHFTSDKATNWHKFFTLASGMTVRQVIESGQAAQISASGASH
ncbi:hypothetical protein [Chromobacterium amazonense]|uniref:Uncharacterized protein n=1 Tax=Chromobacterium amazonense TaxID=1382803 RepID=A0ABU8V5M9_9NEIS|nr:hypothetical protein [Chromobacterium amazonense]MDQ4541506.1 hypothetical protein [Chromobacterium amazonense]